MAGKKDIVEQALKLIAGGAKEAGPSVAERAAKNLDVFNTANRLGVDTNDIAKLQETKRLMDYHKGFMGDVRERAKSANEIVQQMRASGAFPMEIGTRYTTEHSRRTGQAPWTVTNYYVDPKNPQGSYGYYVRRELPDGGYEESVSKIRDPKLEAMHGPEKWEELQRGFVPMTGPKVVKAYGGSIREGYGPGGWVDDVVKMAGKVISGEGDDAAKTGIRAYHGSPHDFDKFDMSKIGTGEGAQAYGHGLYFAEAEPLARNYRQALAGAPTVQFKGDDYALPAVLNELKDWQTANPTGSTYLEGVRKKTMEDAAKILLENVGGGSDAPGVLQNLVNSFPSAAQDTAKGWVQQAEKLIKPHLAVHEPGRMYEVNIAADPDAFLDWDKPLSEQPEVVRDALRQQLPPAGTNPVLDDDLLAGPGKNGPEYKANLGRFVQNFQGQKSERLSKELRDAGIPGIKYLDAGSRGAGEGTRNYVVFDDKLISIIRKYGIAGASAMLGYNLMEQLDPKQALAASMADQDYQSSRPQRSMGGNNSISGALNVARGLNGGE